MDEEKTVSPVPVCKELIRARIRLDINFLKLSSDVDSFKNLWCYQDLVCRVENDLLYGNVGNMLYGVYVVYMWGIYGYMVYVSVWVCTVWV